VKEKTFEKITLDIGKMQRKLVKDIYKKNVTVNEAKQIRMTYYNILWGLCNVAKQTTLT